MSPESAATHGISAIDAMEARCRTLFSPPGENLRFTDHRARIERQDGAILVNIESEWTTVLWCRQSGYRMVQVKTEDVAELTREVAPLLHSGTTH